MHRPIKVVQMLISQTRIIYKTPLPSTMVVTKVVALAWKVDPFWMAKLIAHKIQVPFALQQNEHEDNDKDDVYRLKALNVPRVHM